MSYRETKLCLHCFSLFLARKILFAFRKKISWLTTFNENYFTKSMFFITFAATNLTIQKATMDRKIYEDQLSSLLPEHDELDENYEVEENRKEQVAEAAANKEAKLNAAALARLKMREKYELEKAEKQKTDPTFGMTKKQKEKYEAEQTRIAENIAEIEVIEQSPDAQQFLAGGFSDLSPYAGTTRRDVVKLLSSLNINLSLNLSQSDTYNLLGCLLTCNEAQLQALYNNNKIPLAIKTVIKRIMEDAKLGNLETIEKLWDRIFGKAGKATFEIPAGAQQVVTQGIIPNTIVSREAYTIIRDTIIGKE